MQPSVVQFSRRFILLGATSLMAIVVMLPGCSATHQRVFAPIAQSGARYEVQRGRQLLGKREFDAASSAYARAVKLDPQNAEAHFGLGQIAAHQNDTTSATEHFRAAVRYDPGNYNYALALADFLRDTMADSNEEGGLESVLRAYDFAHHLQPQEPEPLIAIAMCQRQAGDVEEASKSIGDALRINPSSIAAHNEKGSISLARGEYRAALAEFRESLEIDPNDIAAHNGCGEVYAVLARTSGTKGAMNRKQALTHFRRSLQINDRQPHIREMVDSLAPYEYRGVTVSKQDYK